MSFGPLALRQTLRSRTLAGERLIGWRTVRLPTSLSGAFYRAALAAVPGVGALLLTLSGDGSAAMRLLVVTERRILLVAKAPGSGALILTHEWEIESLRISRPSDGRFDLQAHTGPVTPILIFGHGTRAADRALEALTMLSDSRAGVAPTAAVPHNEGGRTGGQRQPLRVLRIVNFSGGGQSTEKE